MLKYAVILLDKTATPFCHADNPYTEPELMPLPTLKEAIRWCMKENLNIQFVYPGYPLPQEYLEAIDSIDHVDIKHVDDADVVVVNGLEEFKQLDVEGKAVVLRICKSELLGDIKQLANACAEAAHISVVITDVDKMDDADFDAYKADLEAAADDLAQSYTDGKIPHLNLLTDRLALDKMNNCNAGWESITIAPNGKFYICPAFYFEDEADSVGSLVEGLNIQNRQLYQLKYAPICRTCDAYHCRRCVWLNRKTTLEVNTPGREQCVAAHLERNAARRLQQSLAGKGLQTAAAEIKEIDYLDPFNNIKR